MKFKGSSLRDSLLLTYMNILQTSQEKDFIVAGPMVKNEIV